MTDFFEPAGRGVQHASLRAANRRAVLTTITFSPGISNADISRRTGLAPQTASAIVSELEAEDLVYRGEVLRGRRGQPATPLFLNYGSAYAFGVEVGWRHLDILLINLGSRHIDRYRRDYAYPDATTIVAEVADSIGAMMERLDPARRHRVVGIGLATPSTLARNVELLGDLPEQSGAWGKLDLRAAIEERTGLTTQSYNDGNAACWAQLVTTPPPRPANFAYLFVGTFLGAGVVSQHTLWEGPTGNSANLGSMLVTGPGGTRQFGHEIASIYALGKRLKAAGLPAPTGNPRDWPWQQWEPHLSAWIAEAGAALAEIVLNAAAVIEVDRAIIDGVLPRPLLDQLITETTAAMSTLPWLTFDHPGVFAGHLGADAAPVGAGQLPLFKKYFSRDLADMLP
ncbi:ROK family transcriptional regulator [Devosia sp.]|uniref:ROK family transcriptional regulator n=1 Tax=Devosia sp. TaxID=1871048 RepID=UPI0035B0ECFD